MAASCLPNVTSGLGVHVGACFFNLPKPQVADVVASAAPNRTSEVAFGRISARLAGNGRGHFSGREGKHIPTSSM